MTDQEIDDVVNHIRNAWGNNGSGVSAGSVAAIRGQAPPLGEGEAGGDAGMLNRTQAVRAPLLQ